MLRNSLKIMQVRYIGTIAESQVKLKPKRKYQQNKDKKKPNSGALISCKRTEFNLDAPIKGIHKFGTIPLASQGWLHYKSKDDYFTINARVAENEQRVQLKDINDFLKENHIQLQTELVNNLQSEMNIKGLTQIQVDVIPKIHDSHHVLIAAETGCGKTLSYLIPIAQRIIQIRQNIGNTSSNSVEQRKLNSPLALIITPGRELAVQIGQVAEQLCLNTDIRVKTVLGGKTKQLMLNPEFDDVDILVASMGAICKLVTTGIYRINHVRHVVLDEADTLLDDSFTDKLARLLRRLPFHRNHMQNDPNEIGAQLILASATMPTNIEEQLKQIVDVQTIHEAVSPNLHKLMPHVPQKFQRMSKSNRPAILGNLIKKELHEKRPIIVFSNKTPTCDYLSIFLNNYGIKCINLNGDMLMKIRLGRFAQFQNGECDVLSTTDVGSRGLDTTRARHVVNYDFPLHISDYIHRCGRIGRVGHTEPCFVTNFISSRREINVVQRIEHAARTDCILPNVNANIKGLINNRIMKEMKKAGLESPEPPVELKEELIF